MIDLLSCSTLDHGNVRMVTLKKSQSQTLGQEQCVHEPVLRFMVMLVMVSTLVLVKVFVISSMVSTLVWERARVRDQPKYFMAKEQTVEADLIIKSFG